MCKIMSTMFMSQLNMINHLNWGIYLINNWGVTRGGLVRDSEAPLLLLVVMALFLLHAQACGGHQPALLVVHLAGVRVAVGSPAANSPFSPSLAWRERSNDWIAFNPAPPSQTCGSDNKDMTWCHVCKTTLQKPPRGVDWTVLRVCGYQISRFEVQG
jgi:hypothetical protein